MPFPAYANGSDTPDHANGGDYAGVMSPPSYPQPTYQPMPEPPQQPVPYAASLQPSAMPVSDPFAPEYQANGVYPPYPEPHAGNGAAPADFDQTAAPHAPSEPPPPRLTRLPPRRTARETNLSTLPPAIAASLARLAKSSSQPGADASPLEPAATNDPLDRSGG